MIRRLEGACNDSTVNIAANASSDLVSGAGETGGLLPPPPLVALENRRFISESSDADAALAILLLTELLLFGPWSTIALLTSSLLSSSAPAKSSRTSTLSTKTLLPRCRLCPFAAFLALFSLSFRRSSLATKLSSRAIRRRSFSNFNFLRSFRTYNPPANASTANIDITIIVGNNHVGIPPEDDDEVSPSPPSARRYAEGGPSIPSLTVNNSMACFNSSLSSILLSLLLPILSRTATCINS